MCGIIIGMMRNDPEKELEGDVGPGVQIGQKKGQDGGYEGRADGEDDRVDEDVGKRDRCGPRRTSRGLNVPSKASRPSLKLPRTSMTTGADREASDNRDQALGVRPVLVLCIARFLSLIQEDRAAARIEVEGNLLAFPDGGRRFDPEDQKGLSDPDSPRRRRRRRPGIRPFP